MAKETQKLLLGPSQSKAQRVRGIEAKERGRELTSREQKLTHKKR